MAKKFGLSGLIGWLQGKGLNIVHNESAESEDELFEIKVNESDEDEMMDEEEMMKKKKKKVVKEVTENSSDDETLVSEEELRFLKTLAQNEQLRAAFQNGSLLKALEAVPAAAELVKNAQAREQVEKEGLIGQIKQNSANTYTDEELAGMSVPVLTKLNAQMNVNYAGLGGGIYQNNDVQALGLPSSFSNMEVNNGS